MKALKGHVDFASGHLTLDYPASWTKRVQRRVWIETGKQGQRSVTNTSTDSTGTSWCAPKKSTYDLLFGIFMVEDSDVGQTYGYQSKAVWTADEVGHVHVMRVGQYNDDVPFLEKFNQMFGPFETQYEREVMLSALSIARATVRRDTEWKPEHPQPEYDRGNNLWSDWHTESHKALIAFVIEETSKIKAADEIPEPRPVAPAQEVVAEGAMF